MLQGENAEAELARAAQGPTAEQGRPGVLSMDYPMAEPALKVHAGPFELSSTGPSERMIQTAWPWEHGHEQDRHGCTLKDLTAYVGVAGKRRRGFT